MVDSESRGLNLIQMYPTSFKLQTPACTLSLFFRTKLIDDKLYEVIPAVTIHGLFARWKFGFVFTIGCGTSNTMCTSFSTLRSRSLQGGLIPTYGCKKK